MTRLQRNLDCRYLSSFHAGRKSGIAKKPYNPILVRI